MIGIIGDLHFKESLGYADCVADGRQEEKKHILSFIVDTLADCDTVVLVGDQLNARNNSSATIREFVGFIERFKDKKLYVIAGNHEKLGDGRSAIDFLGEIKDKHWTIITNEIVKEKQLVFCPYFARTELGTDDNEGASAALLKRLAISGKKDGGRILFVHHAISSSRTSGGTSTEIFNEIVLPRTELEKSFELIFAGHVHTPQAKGKTIITGSVFANEAGDTDKYIWKVDEKTLKVEQIKLPGRSIYGLTDPNDRDLAGIPKSNILKVVITKKGAKESIDNLKEALKQFDGYVLVEQIPHERKKLHLDSDKNIIEFTPEELLTMYAKERKIDLKKLLAGFELIK